MFEELIDVKKMINPESYNPNKVSRPNLQPAVEYEDTPEFRQSLNMKVTRNLAHFKVLLKGSIHVSYPAGPGSILG